MPPIAAKHTATHRVMLPIEEVKPNIWYALTIAPCDDHQKWDETDNRLREFKAYHKTYILKQLLPNKFEMFVEVSPTGRLHFHGRIMFSNVDMITKYYLCTIHRLLKSNQVEMDTIGDQDVWTRYCTKQIAYNFGKITSQDYSKLDAMTEIKYMKIPFGDVDM